MSVFVTIVSSCQQRQCAHESVSTLVIYAAVWYIYSSSLLSLLQFSAKLCLNVDTHAKNATVKASGLVAYIECSLL